MSSSRGHNHSFAGMLAYDGTSMALSIDGVPEMARGAFVSATHTVLGVPSEAGRVFTPSDDRPGAAPVAVIRHEYWKRRFGLNPSAIGKPVDFKRIPFTIVGVTPRACSMA